MKSKPLIIIITINFIVFVSIGVLVSFYYPVFNKFIFPRESIRKDLLKVLDINISKRRLIPQAVVAKTFESEEGYTRKNIVFKFETGKIRKYFRGAPSVTEVRGYLFHPVDTSEKYPAVIVFHGHGKGISDTSITGSSYELSEKLAKKGYVVILYALGDIESGMGYKEHKLASRDLILKGSPLLGKYIQSGIRAIDYLSILDFVDKRSVAVAGESAGGHLAVYMGALDKRVAAVVDAAYFRSYSDLSSDPSDCTCNYIPGSLDEYDFPVVASMIAPKYLMISVGKADKEVSWEFTKQITEKVLKPLYLKNNNAEALKLLIHSGGHGFAVDDTIGWFDEVLKDNN